MKRHTRLFFTGLLLAVNFLPVQGQKRNAKNPNYEQYIEKYKILAIKQQHEYKIPASITLAQGLLESNAGNSRLARLGNNHFGIKCKPEWRGGRIYHDDDEKNECFRTYKSVEESYIDHSLFLAKRKYYVSLFDLDIHDYKGWAHGLQKCGYATDKSYGPKLVGLIETYELYKYDKARILDKTPIIDDIYEIKIHTPETDKRRPAVVNWRRRILKTNEIHYIEAQENDSYEFIAYDTRMKLKRLLKYNEVTKDHKLKEGDRIYLQGKRRYASKDNGIHVVKAGESLHSISQLYGMKLNSLYKLNRIKESYTPKPGDTLKVHK
ncbi:MAG: glucosaminidase domain-containing protein [Tannerella sp.]|jgi:LysM repeat protein|nr:glucosaminidase domain-containing protein [Tannerella sp.]